MSTGNIKTIAKTKFKDHWGVLLLILALAWVARWMAVLMGFGLGTLIVSGPIVVGIYYTYTRAIYEDAADWKDMFYGFRKLFGNSFAIDVLVWFIKALAGVVIGIVGSIISLIITKLASGFATAGSSYYDSYYYGYGNPYSYGSSILTSIGIGFTGVLIMGLAIGVVGIIIGLMYVEAPIILLKEPGIRPVDALKKSRLMMSGNKGRFFLFKLTFIGWFILCALSAGVLLVYVAPYYMYARVLMLNRIYEEKRGISMDDDTDMQKLNAMKESVRNRTEAVTDKIKEKATEIAPAETAKAETPVETAPEPDPTFCKYCGAKLPEGASFCGKCGKRQ